MTKVKLNQNTRTACSRIFPSSLERRASGLPLPAAAAQAAFGGQRRQPRDPGEQHPPLPLHVEISVGCNFPRVFFQLSCHGTRQLPTGYDLIV